MTRTRHGQNRIARNQRLCFACNTNEVEDEYHFLIVCPFFADVRKLFFKKYFYTRPSMLKYKNLMNTNNKGVRKKIVINKGFEHRKSKEILISSPADGYCLPYLFCLDMYDDWKVKIVTF